MTALRLAFLCAIVCPKTAPATLGRPVSPFQAGQGGWQLGTLSVGNIDADSDLEIVVPYRDTTGSRTLWYLDAFKLNGERASGFPYAGGEQAINTSPTLYDLDGDGRAEILFTHGSQVVALRGDGSTLWKTTVSRENYVPTAGYQVVTNGFYWSADNLWHDRLPATSEFFSEVSPPMVADLNGDGSLQVLTAWKILPDSTSTAQDYNPFIKPLFGFDEWGTVGDVWSGGVVSLSAGGNLDFIYHIHQLVESGLGIGRARPNGAPLIYVLNDSDSVVAFDKTKPYGFWGKGMLYKKFGKNQRLQSGSYLKGVDIYPVDIDGDGEDELLVPTTQVDPLWQPSETILDDDGAILWRKWTGASDVSAANGWLNSACMIPVNPDHDNRIDVLSFTHSYQIAFRSWNGIDLVDRPGWPKDFRPFVPTPPVVGDVDGDGQEEIVIGTYDPKALPSTGKLFIFALDGTEKLSRDVPGGLKHIPTLADVDGDGSIEVVYRSLDGQVHIDNFGANPGSRTSWATHRANASHDGNRGISLFPEGTPIVIDKQSGYRETTFHWRTPEGMSARGYEVFRAEQAEGPFERIAALPPSSSSFTDTGLSDGWLYFYEVRALYNTGPVASAPFAILSFVSNNLIANAGFEENDNSHWDKWFTGTIPWQNMTGSTDHPYQGKRSMEIKLDNQGESSSIKQSNQYGTPDPAIRTSAGKLYSFGGWFRSGGISQPSEHWLEWNTTRAGDNTNAIPSAPWPLYFTPHFRIGTEPTDWIYANRVFVMPDGFPNAELRHRYTIANPGSGSIFIDNVFFRELPPLSDSQWRELIAFGSDWKYQLHEPPPGWTAENFNDSSWTQAPAKFGGGTGARNIATSLPLMRPAYYFRRTFNLPDTSIGELLLRATATDDLNGQTYPLQVWLNGKELITSGLDVVSGDGNSALLFDLMPFKDALHAGSNCISVVVRNGWASDWDNVGFDLSLIATPAASHLASAHFQSIRPNADGSVTLTVTGSRNTSWSLEYADSPTSLASWKKVKTIFLDETSNSEVTVTAENAIPPSTPAGMRFYRLTSP